MQTFNMIMDRIVLAMIPALAAIGLVGGFGLFLWTLWTDKQERKQHVSGR